MSSGSNWKLEIAPFTDEQVMYLQRALQHFNVHQYGKKNLLTF